MMAQGLSEEEAAIKAGLKESPVVNFEIPVVTLPLAPKPEMKSVEADRGKVLVEVSVYLTDEPITFLYRTDMRGALVKTQQNRKYLGEKFVTFLRSFLGRVEEVK